MGSRTSHHITLVVSQGLCRPLAESATGRLMRSPRVATKLRGEKERGWLATSLLALVPLPSALLEVAFEAREHLATFVTYTEV